MNRLVHSPLAYVRTLQISKQDIFVFVEGGLDRSFYDRLLTNIFHGKEISYGIRAAKELPGNTGGKATLLSFFRELRRTKKLSNTSLGKKFSTIFFLDKDIDDFLRKKIRSPHIIYTTTYDLEGHLIECGDLDLAIADSCGITRTQATSLIGDKDEFLDNVITNWADWVTLCMISQEKNVNTGCTYERISAINLNGIGEVDDVKLAAFKLDLATKINMDIEEFEILYLKNRKRVIYEISRGNSLKFFKGKWFKHILQEHMNTNLKIPDANANSIGDRILIALLGQVASRIPCSCCDPFDQAVSQVIEKFH